MSAFEGWIARLRQDGLWAEVLSVLDAEGQRVLLLANDESLINGHGYIGDEHLLNGCIRHSSTLRTTISRLVPNVDRLVDDLMWKSSGKVRDPPEHFVKCRELRKVPFDAFHAAPRRPCLQGERASRCLSASRV